MRVASLNKLLRLLANLLFEKGASAPEVARTLSGHVEPRVVRSWHEKYQQLHGFESRSKTPGRIRLPVPPIDWDAVTIETIANIQSQAEEGEPR
jgi:hypothetical protein